MLIQIIKLSPSSKISIGVLSQNASGLRDGAIGSTNNPGVHKDDLVTLWNNIIDNINKKENIDTTKLAKLGLMNWFVNMQKDSISQCKPPGKFGDNCDDMITTWGKDFF